MPQGSVRVTSALPDSLTGISNFVFGGNAGMPTSTETKQIEVTDEASYFKSGSAHRFKLGFFGNITTFNNNTPRTSSARGATTRSADFDNNLPSQFTRTLTPTIHTGDTENGGDLSRGRVARLARIPDGLRRARGGDALRRAARVQSRHPDLFGRNTSLLPVGNASQPAHRLHLDLGAAAGAGSRAWRHHQS